MSIRNDIANEFRRAVVDPQNISYGEPNWDFVEADIMIGVGLDRIIEEMGSLEEFYSHFNKLVGLHIALEAACPTIASRLAEEVA